MKTVVLWDIDKTLATKSGRLDAFHEALQRLCGKAVPAPRVSKDGKSDGQIAREYLGSIAEFHEEPANSVPNSRDIDESSPSPDSVTSSCSSDIDAFMGILDEVSREAFENGSAKMIPTPGASLLLQELASRSVVNGIYTGNTPVRTRLKLANAGLDPKKLFCEEAIFCQGSRPSRFYEVERVRAAFPNERLIVVGDSALDYRLAELVDATFWQVGEAVFPKSEQLLLGSSRDFLDGNAELFMERTNL